MTVNDASIGDLFTASVQDMASDGRGILRHPAGRVVFVPGVWLQEQVRVRLTQLKGRIASGECVEIVQPSPHRIAAPCPHQGHRPGACGGCPWQMIDYAAQLEAKQQRIVHNLAPLGGPQIAPIWPSPMHFGYRNRAQLKTDGRQLGYVSAQSHRLAAIDDCLVLSDANRITLSQLIQGLPNPSWFQRKGRPWHSLDIDDRLTAAEVSVNRRLPFRQPNDQQNVAIHRWLAAKLATFDAQATVLELFAGSGNLTSVIAAQHFASILAVDSHRDALAALAQQQLPQVHTLCADLFDSRQVQHLRQRTKKAQILILDPPRDGFKHIGALLPPGNRLREVVYISCNLATLTRDLNTLRQHGFTLEQVQPLDQCPHTPHIELLTYLRR